MPHVTDTLVNRVAVRFLHAQSGWKNITGADRRDYLDVVWNMLVNTYKTLGMPHKSPGELMMDYPLWDLSFDSAIPNAFHLLKTTPFGSKSGVGGSDGSPAGRNAIKQLISRSYYLPGHYGEVSHKLETLALASGAPVVCAAFVGAILGKRIEPQKDGIHYRRNITGVGPVIKIMVGRPKGIPVTDIRNPSCPVENTHMASPIENERDPLDLASHLACLVTW